MRRFSSRQVKHSMTHTKQVPSAHYLYKKKKKNYIYPRHNNVSSIAGMSLHSGQLRPAKDSAQRNIVCYSVGVELSLQSHLHT